MHDAHQGIPHWVESDRMVVWMTGNQKFVVRAFSDSGAQVCFITKKLAQHLAPIGNGHNFKYIKVGKGSVKIQTYQIEEGNLPVTLANQQTAVFTEYLPNVRICYGHKEITVNLWICPDSGDEDISLSKSAMHQLGFQLVDLYGESIWDTDSEPQAKVQIN